MGDGELITTSAIKGFRSSYLRSGRAEEGEPGILLAVVSGGRRNSTNWGVRILCGGGGGGTWGFGGREVKLTRLKLLVQGEVLIAAA